MQIRYLAAAAKPSDIIISNPLTFKLRKKKKEFRSNMGIFGNDEIITFPYGKISNIRLFHPKFII